MSGARDLSQAPPPALPVPTELVDELLGYALQTVPGKALWRGYLLGAGLPKGDGSLQIQAATYTPKTEAPE